jgi:rSAM/selenodomain-associated transferase 2
LSVIIPSLNEERTIADAVSSSRAAGAAEIIVADAGSSDGTREVARAEGAIVLEGESARGRQLNQGAALAKGDILLFLHADTILPAGAAEAVARAVDQGFRFGGFRIRFREQSARLRVAARMINSRTAITRCPWGDQAQFVERETFFASGGFRDFPFLEDYELAVRMRRRVRTVVLPLHVETSGRRFLQKGVLRTAAINWTVIALYRLGVSPTTLTRLYR